MGRDRGDGFGDGGRARREESPGRLVLERGRGECRTRRQRGWNRGVRGRLGRTRRECIGLSGGVVLLGFPCGPRRRFLGELSPDRPQPRLAPRFSRRQRGDRRSELHRDGLRLNDDNDLLHYWLDDGRGIRIPHVSPPRPSLVRCPRTLNARRCRRDRSVVGC